MKKFYWTYKYIKGRGRGREHLNSTKRQSCPSVTSSIESQALQKSVFEYCGANLVGIQQKEEDRDVII